MKQRKDSCCVCLTKAYPRHDGPCLCHQWGNVWEKAELKSIDPVVVGKGGRRKEQPEGEEKKRRVFAEQYR